MTGLRRASRRVAVSVQVALEADIAGLACTDLAFEELIAGIGSQPA